MAYFPILTDQKTGKKQQIFMNKAVKIQMLQNTVYIFSKVIIPCFIISQFLGRIFIDKEITCLELSKIHCKITQQSPRSKRGSTHFRPWLKLFQQ